MVHETKMVRENKTKQNKSGTWSKDVRINLKKWNKRCAHEPQEVKINAHLWNKRLETKDDDKEFNIYSESICLF